MSHEEFSSFRPISNLKFISKVIEKVVATQLLDHLDNNKLHEKFQSAYKKHHSVETTLLKVHDDILSAIDSQRCVILVLLDLSAAFDTVSHQILLKRLSNRFGVKGTSLKWFESYLAERSFYVKVKDGVSRSCSFACGVPQGSILGPILFILYMGPLSEIIKRHNLEYHFYADDTQLYMTFAASSQLEADEARFAIEACAYDIKCWMTENRLKVKLR